MKHLALLFIAAGLPYAASAGCIGPVIMGECQGTVTPFETNAGVQQPPSQPESLRPNVYGPGVHENRYGQPVTLVPQGGGVPGERLQITPDAYGPGVHMDQYGRPVREKSWP
jgi:hypothetical protein